MSGGIVLPKYIIVGERSEWEKKLNVKMKSESDY